MGAIAADAQRVSLRALINPHPRQQEFLSVCDEKSFVLYGGARGGGKSYIGRWGIVRRLLKYTAKGFKNLRAGIFCNTFPELRLRQWDEAKKEFPAWLGTFHETLKEFRFHAKWGGHAISFLNLDQPEKYKGSQFVAIYVDELTLCADRGLMFMFLGVLRWPGIEDPLFSAGTNPDGPGHSWVKGLFLTGQLFQHPDFATFPKEQFAFVRALPTDNPHLPEIYIKQNLEGLPESLRKPWLEGSWELFEGQRFEFNPRVHYISNRLLSDLGPAKYYRSIDYGFDNPYACGWYAVTRDDNGRQRIYKVREDVRSGLKAHQQIARVHEITEELGIQHQIELTFLDTACWKEEDEGLSIADKFIQGGIPVVQALKDRAAGWVELESQLAYKIEDGDVTQFPGLTLFECCILTGQQMTDAMWDPKKPGDILHPEGFRDDALDETRYFCLTHKQMPQVQPESNHFEEMKRRWKYIARAS